MSGHSKWASIKHKKAAQDAKRGKIFTKVIRELAVAARMGGGDPDTNPRLRKAISDAKGVNMPADNIKRAIMKGTGELEGVTYDEISYEGYGPGGVAIFLEVLTDNKNRAVSELRHIFSKNGGNIGESGCVAWMFNRKGYLVVEKSKASEDDLLDIILEAGAEDLREDGSNYEIFTPPDKYEAVVEALENRNIEIAASNLGQIMSNWRANRPSNSSG
jgi:YebC/PmpR family DNA-binding regulatory protein